MGDRNLTNVALTTEMAGLFGPTHAALLLGWCAVAGLYGVEDAAGFLDMPFGGRSTRYKRLAEIRQLRQSLIDKGYDVSPDEDPVLAVARVAIVPM